jgi:hypothetical protein
VQNPGIHIKNLLLRQRLNISLVRILGMQNKADLLKSILNQPMFLRKTKLEPVVKTMHLAETLRLIQSLSPLITTVIPGPHDTTVIMEVNQLVLPRHIILQQEQIQRVIVNQQELHVLTVVPVIRETAEVILLQADLPVVVNHIHRLQDHPLHLPDQVVEVVQGHQAVEDQDQVEEEDNIIL